MKNLCSGLLAATLLCGRVSAAEPAVTTPSQQEVRAALTEHGWDITQDAAGKLVAERLWVNQGGTTGFHVVNSVNTFEPLEIYLQADGKSHPAGSAYASLRTYGRLNKSYLLYPEHAFRDPKLTQEYRDIVAEAKAHTATESARKVAMR